jgi:hypothetical protein
MSGAKLHHYVPQFHLRRFADEEQRLWVWDRDQDRVFRTVTGSVAAETQFYRLSQDKADGHDPLEMERQLASLEGEVAIITGQWLDWLRDMNPLEQVPIPAVNREIVSLYLAVQYLRTADTRDILARLSHADQRVAPSDEEARRLHTELLWDETLVNGLAWRLHKSNWLFARNLTQTPFVTSDNPVTFRSADNRRWLRAGITTPGTYAGFPMAPDLILYCHPKEPPWVELDRFADKLSPVEMDDAMAESENSGQVFMATRFLFSNCNGFDAERAFAQSIRSDSAVDS